MKPIVIGLALLSSHAAFATQFQVEGLFTCYKVTSPYPEYNNCTSEGTYQAIGCDQAFQMLHADNKCCGQQTSTFKGRSCRAIGG